MTAEEHERRRRAMAVVEVCVWLRRLDRLPTAALEQMAALVEASRAEVRDG